MLNFKKSTIFSRKIQDDKEENTAVTGGVLSVWGSVGSGKSLLSAKLAKYLSDKKNDVVLLLSDMTAPMLPCIAPTSEFMKMHSLGSILAAAHVTENLVKHNLITLKRNSHLSILGMLKGENEYTYPPFEELQATELIETLRNIAPFVIVDCSSYIANDILSAVALMKSDNVMRLANCDLKSISYLSSQLPLLKDKRWEQDKQYKIASNVKSYQATEQISNVLGKVAFNLPYSKELEEQYLEGNLLADLCMKNSRSYRREIKKIAKEVFNV